MKISIERSQKLLSFLSGSEKIEKIKALGVAVENEIPDNSILFIGINPSYDEKKKDDENYNKPSYDLKTVTGSGFFKKAAEIACDNNKPFGHHDLFPIRETDQKVIEGMFNVSGYGITADKQYSDFVEKSLRLAESIIRESKPYMIIVANAFVTHLFFDFRFNNGDSLLGFLPGDKGGNWNEELGVDFVNIAGRQVPILFSGMLAGQRALDFGSEFRLKWHIRHIISNENKWRKIEYPNK